MAQAGPHPRVLPPLPPPRLSPQPLRSAPEELPLLIVPAVCSGEHPTPVHQDAGAVEREATEEGHLPGLRAVSARGAGGHDAGACVVCGEQQSLRDWRKKAGGGRSSQGSNASTGFGIREGPQDGAFSGVVVHSLSPTACVGIGCPEATEWKWAENGVRGERRPEGPPLVAQTGENLPARQETRVRSLGRENPLEDSMATQSRIHAREIPWTEELGGLQCMMTERLTLSLSLARRPERLILEE